jgi:integrase
LEDLMTQAGESEPRAIVLLGRGLKARSVKSDASRRRGRRHKWQPPEGVSADDAAAIIAGSRCSADCSHVNCERNELLLRTLWATGARISEVLGLTPAHVLADSLVVPTLKNGVESDGSRPWRRVYLPAGQRELPAALLIWANTWEVGRHEPLFFGTNGSWRASRPRARPLKAISRQQAWEVVKRASRRAGVLILAMRRSVDGARGEPAPVHPHIFRHARAREIVRRTRSLPLAQRQLGWQQLHLEYLKLADDETRQLMAGMVD